jgi:tripartite-type tricarboxylate transporter receptor subunit TctC
VRFIVTYAPGAGTDTTARTIAARLAQQWGQQVVVDNRTGGGGAVGIEYTANANPDGYTIGLATASHATAQASGQKLGYDLTKDLQPITQATSVFYVVYVPLSMPVKSIRELIAYAKANPGKLNYGTSGPGSLQHLGGELLSHMAGLQMVHVAYKGSAPIITAMLANEVHLGFNSMFSVRPQVQAGRLRWIAMTASKRSPIVDLPTVAESGLPGYEVLQWYGVLTNSKVPAPVVQKLHAGITEALRAPDVAQRLSADGSDIVGSSPAEFGAYLKSDIAKWRKLIQEAHLKLH